MASSDQHCCPAKIDATQKQSPTQKLAKVAPLPTEALIARNLNSVAVRTLISVAYGGTSKTWKFTLYRICNYP